MKKLIGNKAFYKSLFVIFLPIVFQQFITSFVGLLDNLMIGASGNDQMVGVSLGNQLFFIVNLVIFGTLSGASIFATQYYGAKDKEGYQEAFRFKWLMISIILILTIVIMALFNKPLLSLFINSVEGEYTSADAVLENGSIYIVIMLFGIIPFGIKEIYAQSLREMKETLVPMIASFVALFVNLCLNYVLIFGKLGFPVLGVKGAAIATVISRFIEMLVVIIYAHVKKEKFPFFINVYKKLLLRFSSFKMYIGKTILMLSNEALWSLGLTVIVGFYAKRGLDAAALNIANTINNLFLIVGLSLGSSIAIIMGNLLGANKIEEARDASYKLIFASFVLTLSFAVIQICCGFLIPNIYNTSDSIRVVARNITIVYSLYLAFFAINNACYYTIRSGGRILLTMMFDSWIVWLIKVPVAFFVITYTDLNIILALAVINIVEIAKSIAGCILVRSGIWLKKIV